MRPAACISKALHSCMAVEWPALRSKSLSLMRGDTKIDAVCGSLR